MIDKFRFFVADEQGRARSGCWHVVANKDDVFLGPDATGQTLKVSFHANDGRSLDGFNSQYWKGPKRARWKRPETPPVGAAHVASILFPANFLGGTIPPFRPGRTRLALPLARAGHAIEVGVFFCREGPLTIEARLASAGSTPIGWFSLVGGENVVAAAREVPLNATAIPSASEMSRGVHALSGAPKIGETVVNCSGVALLKKPAHGEPIILAEINGLTITRNS